MSNRKRDHRGHRSVAAKSASEACRVSSIDTRKKFPQSVKKDEKRRPGICGNHLKNLTRNLRMQKIYMYLESRNAKKLTESGNC